MFRIIIDWIKRVDIKLTRTLYNWVPKNSKNKTYLRTLEYSCHGIPWLALTIIFVYLFPKTVFLSHLLVGLIMDIVYVAIIKALSRRRRPSIPNVRQDDQFFQFGVDKHSFPSGHASRAIYVAMFFGDPPSVLSFIIWLWAVAVCCSRVLLGRHHVGDVLAGVVLGYLEFVTQFTVLSPVSALLRMLVGVVLGTSFANSNDSDMEMEV